MRKTPVAAAYAAGAARMQLAIMAIVAMVAMVAMLCIRTNRRAAAVVLCSSSSTAPGFQSTWILLSVRVSKPLRPWPRPEGLPRKTFVLAQFLAAVNAPSDLVHSLRKIVI